MKIYKIIGIAVGAIVAGTGITLSALNPTNRAETGETATDDLQTRRYELPDDGRYATEKSLAVMQIERILSEQKTYGRSWKVVETKMENDLITIKAEVPVVFFTDDLEVRIEFLPMQKIGSARRKAIINIRSASRVGKSDLGENQRHIKQLLEALDFAFADEKL